jgi:tetratricopeptide (TPR) repeat protein
MTTAKADNTIQAGARGRRENILPVALVLVGLAGAIMVALWMERHPRPVQLVPAEERLYVSGAAAKRMSLAFNAIIADWYWMRALQYVGGKAVQHGRVRVDNLSELDLKLLAPLLDTAATLDPKFMALYEYGAVVLPTVSDTDEDEAAIALLKKGIEANPGAWRLYHHLGYIYWQRGDYRAASEAYGRGAELASAPAWMKGMEANMLARGSSPQLAREIYARMHGQSSDEQVKVFAAYRLAQLDSMDERAAITRMLAAYGARTGGRCPSAWREITPELRAAGLRTDSSGAPLDPTNIPYVLTDKGCSVDLHPESKIPRR